MKPLHAATFLLLCLVNLTRANATVDPALAPQSTPELAVRVYSFPGFTRPMLTDVEKEAIRMLHPVHLKFSWVDCTSRPFPASCSSPQTPSDLVVRFLAKALPQASTSALGIAGSTDGQGVAFVFHDRVLALRTQQALAHHARARDGSRDYASSLARRAALRYGIDERAMVSR